MIYIQYENGFQPNHLQRDQIKRSIEFNRNRFCVTGVKKFIGLNMMVNFKIEDDKKIAHVEELK
jgi:hypothetical protein